MIFETSFIIFFKVYVLFLIFFKIVCFIFLGKITVYLGRRDFVDNTNVTEPVDGVVLIDNDYTRGRKVFAAVSLKIISFLSVNMKYL